MSTDIELLPSSVAAFTEALKGGRGSLDAWLEVNDEHEVAAHIEAYARANVAHATAAKDAEIEALREDVASWKDQAMHNLDLIERLEEALRELVALGHPRDPAIIAAKNALRDHDQEEGSGAFWGSSPKSGGPDWTGFDG